MNDHRHAVGTMTGVLALDALDDDDRALIEALLADDPEAAAEAAGFVETAAELADGLDPVPPRPSLRASVLARVAETRQLPPLERGPAEAPVYAAAVADPAPDPESAPAALVPVDRYRASVRLSRLFALAAGTLLVTSVAGLGLYTSQRATTEEARETIAALQTTGSISSREISTVDTILAAGDMASTTIESENGGALRVFYTVDDGAMLVAGDELPELPLGQVYQLWLIAPDTPPVPSELLPDADGRATIEADMDGVTSLALSVEPAGGSTTPTTVVAMGDL